MAAPDRSHREKPANRRNSLNIQLLRPAALSRVCAGGQLRGIGWVKSPTPITAIDVSLCPAAGAGVPPHTSVPLGKAQLGLTPDDCAMLTGKRVLGAGIGFVFTVQVPDLAPGPVTLRLVARSTAGDGIRDVSLVMRATNPEPSGRGARARLVSAPRPDNEAIRFYLDAPTCQNGVAVDIVRGFLSIVGWALGRDGIDRIEVFVDGVSHGRAHHGVRREDLQAAFPGVDAARAGFAMMLPPQVMRPGTRQIRIDICDKAGRIKEISFAVNAEAPATGPGPWTLRRKLPQADIDLQHAILAATGPAPCWTILIALADSAPATRKALMATLASLRWQAFDDWSMILLADAPAGVACVATEIDRVCPDLRERIRILPPQRPAARPRKLADLADGFLLVLDPGDILGEDALLELAVAAVGSGDADFVYSDERRVDPADGVEKAFFKPDFSPDLLLSTNYIGRLWAVTHALLARTGLTENDLRTYGDYDAVLRLTEAAHHIVHVAKVLCARQSRIGPARKREQAALTRAMARRRIKGLVLPGPVRGTWRVRRDVAASVTANAVVSIIIPTIAAGGLIRKAIESIRAHSAAYQYEIICLDNIPRKTTTELRTAKRWIAAQVDRCIEMAEPFNWSRFNNGGAAAARGNFLLFLNDDIEVRDETWLTGLLEHAQRDDVGVVGPRLLYPDGRVQHAGVFLARHAARHAFRFYGQDEPGPFGLARVQRDVISVTGAAMMMRREVFDQLNGFDETHAIINNDLDFNLRARAAGLSVIYTPAVSLTHHEAVSRGALAEVFDSPKFLAAWGDLFLKGDPFFSRHLSPDADDYVPDSEPLRCFAAGNPLFARDKIRRILVLKIDHIGDFITAFPALRRLKQHFPEAELTVLVSRASLQLAALEPAIDRVIEFNFFHARSDKGRRAGFKADLAALAAQLAPQRFDLAIDLRRQIDTRPILQATGARWLAGFESGYIFPWLDISIEFEGDIALCHKNGHISGSLVNLVDHVSAQCETDRDVVHDPIARVAARRALHRLLPGIADSHPLVCVHTGAGALNKQWPAASFAGLIDLLVSESRAAVVLIGTPEESAFAKLVLSNVRRRSSVTSLVGRTRLRDLPAVLRAADLYVGNDSGPKHLAAALGVPTIGIHSGSVDAVEWGALGPNALTIRRDMSCSPCYLARADDCHRGLACLDGIRVGDVFVACLALLRLATRAAALPSAGFRQAAE